MAYRSVLGGSPLGLIGVRSLQNAEGLGSFNIDKARNVNVQQYNKSRGGSIIGGKKNIRAWLDVKKIPPSKDKDGKTEVPDVVNPSGSSSEQEKQYVQQTLHNDSIYDISILNIIEKLANTQGALRPTDFAYLKDLGVYPNNRLMIARRFASPPGDNIVALKTSNQRISAIATIIQWIPQDTDFLKISFGEKWEEAEADFTGVLDNLGKDLGLNNLGGIGGAAGNIIPLPGFTEILQRQFLTSLGLLEGTPGNQIPAGNPNLIKEAKRRKTIGYGDAGSGLDTGCSISFTTEYEMKFISGIDPTIVWMDIIANIGRFGTSESSTYGLSKTVAAKMNKWLANPQSLIRDVFNAIKAGIGKAIEEVKTLINNLYEAATAAATDAADKESEESDPDSESTQGTSGEEPDFSEADAIKSAGSAVLNGLGKVLSDVTTSLITKYRVRISGIVNALSGQPSCPWHITIGNPMRPAFCSGDMLCKSLNLTLGPTLGFNDLPSSIKVEFTLENARSWGLQEIMAKFNAGYLRSVDVQKSYFETSAVPENNSKDAKIFFEPSGELPGDADVYIDENGKKVKVQQAPAGTQSTASPTNTGNSATNTNNSNNSANTNTPSGSTASTNVTSPPAGATSSAGSGSQLQQTDGQTKSQGNQNSTEITPGPLQSSNRDSSDPTYGPTNRP
jgi:hypothetical protein